MDEEKSNDVPPLEVGDGAESYVAENIPLNPDCKHYFILVAEGMIQCKDCLIGYQLSSGDRIFDGHLYLGEKMII